MRRKAISLLLIMAMLLSVAPLSVSAQETICEFDYEVIDGKVVIWGCNLDSGDLIIPSRVDGYPVTEIAETAFLCSGLTSITIPKSVTTIGDSAFAWSSLKTVYYNGTWEQWNAIAIGKHNEHLLAANLVIHEHSFINGSCECGEGDASVYSYLVTDGEATITYVDTAISGDITIPSRLDDYPVTTIDEYAFSECLNLNSVIIPNGVTSIGERAFFACCYITSISISESVTSIGEGAFSCCERLASIAIPEGITTIGKSTFAGCSSITNITIPKSVTTIGIMAFIDCSALTSIVIPENVTSIGAAAFENCKGLTSITIMDNVTGIGNGAFFGCSSLETVHYTGTKEQWDAVLVNTGNDYLLNANIICNYGHAHNYEGVVTKEPTKTEMGVKTYICSVCGDSYTEALPTLFYGTNVDLGNSLNLNFYFYKGVVGAEGYVQFVRSFADGTTKTTKKNLSEFGFNGDYYQITYPGLSAMEMNDAVSVTVFDKDGKAVSETKTDSMCSYVRRALDKITDPVSRRMYVDMLSYGAAAQLNFGYNTGNLATDILTQDEKKEGTQSLAAMTNRYTRSNRNYYGTNFDLENEIKLNLFVLASAMGENGYAEITYTNFKGVETTKTVTNYTANGSYLVFTPDFVVAADGRCLLNIKFCKADGTEVVIVTDSMESYVARAVEKDPEKYSWMQQMMIYSDSARAYLLQSN